MWPQLGGHLVVRPHPEPLGQDHEPAGAQPDELTDARGAAVGTERTGGAIEHLLCACNVLKIMRVNGGGHLLSTTAVAA